MLWETKKRKTLAKNLTKNIKGEILIIVEVNDNRNSDKKIDISMIVRISPIKKRFYVFIKLENNLKILTINSLVDTRKKRFFFIDYQFARNLKNKININMIIFLKSKEYRIFNGKKTHLIIHTIYLPIKIKNHYIQMNAFYVVKIVKHPIIIKRK